jgi:hypothetical protein
MKNSPKDVLEEIQSNIEIKYLNLIDDFVSGDIVDTVGHIVEDNINSIFLYRHDVLITIFNPTELYIESAHKLLLDIF